MPNPPNPAPRSAEQQPNRPVKVLKIGNLSASVWKRDGEHGPWYTTTFQRAYKDGEEWKFSNSFGKEHLGNLRLLVDLARNFIIGREVETE